MLWPADCLGAERDTLFQGLGMVLGFDPAGMALAFRRTPWPGMDCYKITSLPNQTE